VRFAADPASVPGARRFVADGLASWGLPRLVEDATLCVSELAGNAALHSGSRFMQVSLRRLGDAVRVAVEDEGAVPTEAVVPRPSFPDPDDELDVLLLENESTTGRGLAIVSILAREWGVETTDDGKRIWAEVGDADEEHGVRLPHTHPRPHVDEQNGAALPPGWTRVRLVGCPVVLSLRQDEHLDELVREFQLLSADGGDLRSRGLAEQLQGLLSAPAHARHTGRRIAQQAAADGLDSIDVEMAMPREFSGEVQKLQVAVAAADELCEEVRLLTVASTPEVRALRAWMTDQMVTQIEHDAVPVAWEEWRAAHPADLDAPADLDPRPAVSSPVD
jgi:anti-sigma regulatory factor (Ser/Thr protein kinase)